MAAPLIRKSVYAGAFYPGTAFEINQQLGALASTAGDQSSPRHPPILILPHAGWVYSGLAAMRGVATLVDSPPRRIVLLGPSHHHYFLGFSLGGYAKYQTPLGEIDGDLVLQQELSDATGFTFVQEADEDEHSIEVILPMLQFRLPAGFKILPIQAGSPSIYDINKLADALASLLNQISDTLIVSTDLSHFYSYDKARELDAETIVNIIEGNDRAILARSGEDGRLCCGSTGVAVAINLAKKWSLGTPKLLMHYNSGDSGGDRKRVVGYASISYPPPELNVDEQLEK
jgi:MEMO1 family protein